MPLYFAYGSNMDEVALLSRCPAGPQALHRAPGAPPSFRADEQRLRHRASRSSRGGARRPVRSRALRRRPRSTATRRSTAASTSRRSCRCCATTATRAGRSSTSAARRATATACRATWTRSSPRLRAPRRCLAGLCGDARGFRRAQAALTMTAAFCTQGSRPLREYVAAWRASGKLVALVPTMGALPRRPPSRWSRRHARSPIGSS